MSIKDIPTIQAVIPLFDYVIAIKFSDGANRYYDVSQLFTHKVLGVSFRKLKTSKTLFSRVKVDDAGLGISWARDIELDCFDLYWHSKSFESGNNGMAKVATGKKSLAETPATT